MLFDPKHEDRFDRLTEQLRLSPALKPDHLISNVIVHACTQFHDTARRPYVVTATTARCGAAPAVAARAESLPLPGTRIKQPDCQARAQGAALPGRAAARTGNGPPGPWS